MPNALTNVNYVYYNMLNLKLICSVLETKGIVIIYVFRKTESCRKHWHAVIKNTNTKRYEKERSKREGNV